ncbi:MAG TPA: DEAD/DEAH box helicase [Actinomycetota bacterium]|nr:DEAD/DEAH box helicase [Actinomycetota bacterium]
MAARAAATAGEAAETRATATSPGLLPADPVRAFEDTYGFPFDEFQRRACTALVDGSSVLVAAPTGAGKTVVGEFAAWLASQGTGKTFYTTPIKALSNQKYGDFLALHGPSNVGLLTGDNSLNGDAPVVVMTTEVLRNMIYEDSPELHALEYVVLDEVHYLQDRYRGGVWEEILIHLPVDVKIVSLSATVSNAEEFAEWLQTLRGRTEVIIEESRPVEIKHWYFASDELLPMFVRGRDGEPHPNPRGQELDRRRRRGGPSRPGQGGRREREKRARIPWRSEVVDRLQADAMLPAIYFIFSRKGCDEAVRQCMRESIRLTNSDERRQIVEYADSRVSELNLNELDVLGYGEWIAGLSQGLAAHHAGMIPPFKETVEELFARGLVKVVFATETLALGINMPARTVVIESLMKFTGEKHELITPGQYTQLSGRAGRRGIDEIGHSVVLLQRFTPFDTITRLASTRTYPLQSSFQPSYNMAVNLVRNYDRHEAEHLVNSSFAQFQTDRDVVRLERKRERSEAYLASYRERMQCERGDFEEYMDLRNRLARMERRGGRGRVHEQVLEAIGDLKPGDVIDLPAGRRRGRYAVIEVSTRRSETVPRVLVLSEERTMIRLAPVDFREPPRAIARLRLPRDFNVRDLSARRKLARQLAALEQAEPPEEQDDESADEVKALRRAVASHPVASCPEVGRHIHFAERATRLEKEIAGVDRQVARRTATLARRFDRVLSVLEELGYVDEWTLTDKGERLTRVYNESDLLVVEMLDRGLLAELEPAELAAVCSSLVYETRGPETETAVEMPTPRSRQVHGELMRLWKRIRRREDERALELTREPDPGFADKAFRWAAGWPLEDVLSEDDPAGDFVRAVKQLIDLLRQIEEVTGDEALRDVVTRAVDGLHRGVVAYSSLEI